MCAKSLEQRKATPPKGRRNLPRGEDKSPLCNNRTCPAATRQTIADFSGRTELPCPKAYVFQDKDTKATFDPNAETPCCFDCEEFKTCGNGDPKYAALPCINDLCPRARTHEYRRIAHCRAMFVYQHNKAVGNIASEAAKAATSINGMMIELVAENERRQKSGTVGVAPPERDAPPDPKAIKQANIQTEAAHSSCPPIAGDEP